MSRRRFVWTSTVLVCVTSGAVAGTAVTLPLDWPIREAAAHAQQVVNGSDAGVTPPKLVSEVKPQYTPEAMQAKIQGSMLMNAVVRTDGTPADIQIIKSLDAEFGLDQQATAAFREWRFEPGLKDGEPVPARVTVEMVFRLKK